jgi:hypothetical protein
MPEKRQAIVTAIKARFANITTANGYRTNIGAIQKEWQTTPLDAGEKPAHMIQDPLDTKLPDKNGEFSSRHQWALDIHVQTVLAEADQTAAEARKSISDVKDAVKVDPTWGGLAKRSEEVSDRVTRDPAGTNTTGGLVIFRVITSRAQWEG